MKESAVGLLPQSSRKSGQLPSLGESAAAVMKITFTTRPREPFCAKACQGVPSQGGNRQGNLDGWRPRQEQVATLIQMMTVGVGLVLDQLPAIGPAGRHVTATCVKEICTQVERERGSQSCEFAGLTP